VHFNHSAPRPGGGIADFRVGFALIEGGLSRAFGLSLRYSAYNRTEGIVKDRRYVHVRIASTSRRPSGCDFAQRALRTGAVRHYFALFIGFVLLNVFSPGTMTGETIPLGPYELNLGGPNLAVVYGIGLIFAAIALALVYMRLTKQPNHT
jgi:hypothetical protein